MTVTHIKYLGQQPCIGELARASGRKRGVDLPKVIQKTPTKAYTTRARPDIPFYAAYTLRNTFEPKLSRAVNHLGRGLIGGVLLDQFPTLDHLFIRLYELTAVAAESSAKVPASVALDVETSAKASSVGTLKYEAQSAQAEPTPAHALSGNCKDGFEIKRRVSTHTSVARRW
ncbi:MAG: hypothetical protein Q9169_000941 [Polycauliona sp. 2 TL-2023]